MRAKFRNINIKRANVSLLSFNISQNPHTLFIVTPGGGGWIKNHPLTNQYTSIHVLQEKLEGISREICILKYDRGWYVKKNEMVTLNKHSKKLSFLNDMC